VLEPLGNERPPGKAGQNNWGSSFDVLGPTCACPCARLLIKLALYSCFQHVWCTFTRVHMGDLEDRVKSFFQARYQSPRPPYTGELIFTFRMGKKFASSQCSEVMSYFRNVILKKFK